MPRSSNREHQALIKLHLIMSTLLWDLNFVRGSVQVQPHAPGARWAVAPLRLTWNFSVAAAGQWSRGSAGRGAGRRVAQPGLAADHACGRARPRDLCGRLLQRRPASGNVMLPDGRLGLIDGQVKKIDHATRMSYAKLIVALDEENQEEVCRIMGASSDVAPVHEAEVCTGSPHSGRTATRDITGGRNIAEFMEWAEEQDPVEIVNQDIVMACRVNVMMRGMANAFSSGCGWRRYGARTQAYLAAHGEAGYSAKRPDGVAPEVLTLRGEGQVL